MTQAAIADALTAALQKARAMDAPVNERLAVYADALRKNLAPFAEAVDRLVERLEKAGAGSHAPRIGQSMPSFLLPDADGRLVNLHDMLKEGPAVIAFHRGHWCPYCEINSVALTEVHADLTRAGAQVVAITPERQSFTALHAATVRAPYRILSDMNNGYALSLNLAIWVGEEMKSVMSEFGRDLEAYQGNPSWFLPIPATFVVKRDGKISARFVDPDYRRRMDIDALLDAAARAV